MENNFSGSINIDGQIIIATEKTFSTGSKGYHGVGKVFLNGKKYQVNTMLIEVGSKPATAKGKK